MARRTIAPSLADIRQDIAGSIPIDLILKWATGEKSPGVHKKLLAPYCRTGTVVSSDSAGLSKLTGERSLLEVLQLVSQPKEIIHAYGKKIGGRAIGVWVADNTEMFYDNSIQSNDVVTQMIGAQKEIAQLLVHVGLAIHKGVFWEIGGGLYGEEADFVELVAEDSTAGGEIVISHTVKESLQVNLKNVLSSRDDLSLTTPVYRVQYDKVDGAIKKDADIFYPLPFDKEFYDALKLYTPGVSSQDMFQSYLSEKIVILVKIHHEKRTLLLDQLTDAVLASAVMKQVKLSGQVLEVKSNGSLGIFVTTDAHHALEFAKDIKQAMKENDRTVSIGIAAGEVLLFPKTQEIAGGPVNIASKLAEDIGESGIIYVHESVRLDTQHDAEAFVATVSHVELRGHKFR